MLELQNALTLTFNVVCIGYSTLAAANFILGLMEAWHHVAHETQTLSGTHHSQPEPAPTEESEQGLSAHEHSNQRVADVLEVRPVPEQCEGQELPLVEPAEPLGAGQSVDGIRRMTLRELKKLASKSKIPYYGTKTKAELVRALIYGV